MNAYLLEISLGPVQGFIAAARRSRDLWAGSFILSELTRAAGKALLRNNAKLIYPLSGRVTQINPDEDSNLSNIVLAQVQAAHMEAVRSLAETAKQAARDRLAEFASEAWERWTGAGVQLRGGFWQRQVDDAFEAYAAWAAIGPDGYRPAYDRLKTALAARKNTRNFEPMFPLDAIESGSGVPKCSFDGLRESVLPPGRRRLPSQFGLSEGEQLDALGCIKRVIGRRQRFPALTRMATDGWIGRLPDEVVARLREAYEPLVGLHLATRTPSDDDPFPYDAGLLFPERLERTRQEIGSETEEGAAIAEALARLERELKPLWAKWGRPCPYAVLVVADGDRMGRFVDKAREDEEHTRISAAVAAFADRVPEIAKSHGGQCIFNGGEDLTLLLPLASVILGAEALNNAFKESMNQVATDLVGSDEEAWPTLRVGAALCHVLEPLGTIRQWGSDAEKFAKSEAGSRRQGNALALKLHIRSGQEIGLRLSFDDGAGFDALKTWQAAYTKHTVPGRLAYDTRSIFLQCQAIGVAADVAEAEFLRLLDRARRRGGGEHIPDDIADALIARRRILAAAVDADDPAGLQRLGDELILARWLAAATAGDVRELRGGE